MFKYRVIVCLADKAQLVVLMKRCHVNIEVDGVSEDEEAEGSVMVRDCRRVGAH